MKIRDWLGRLAYTLVQGSLDEDVEDVVYDSRKARPRYGICLHQRERQGFPYLYPGCPGEGLPGPGDRKGCGRYPGM